jgi:type IV pilus assembly protein PilM
VDQIVLAGGCAALPGIDEMVETRLRIPTNVANPFSRMSTSSRVSGQKLGDDAPSMMIACGLALRSFH